jgi:hypothetical protein
MPVTENNFTDSLIALKSQYERSLTEADTKAILLREQLSHVNSLLLNQLVPTKAHIKSAAPALTLNEADAQADRLSLSPAIAKAPASETPKTKASARKAKAAPDSTPALGKRSPRPLLPAYQGLTRLEAIAQLLKATPGEEATIDALIHGLFGNLSAAEHKAERLKLKTLMYQGEKRELWQKGSVPSSYLIKGSTGKGRGSRTVPQPPTEIAAAPVTEAIQPASKGSTKARAKAKAPKPPSVKTKQRISLSVLPVYAHLTKREAIAQVLGQHPGEMLHHNTIIQSLYGELSPEDLREERVRIKTALFAGMKDGKWQKASVPSSYFLEAPAAGAKPKSPGRKAKASKPQSEPVAEVVEAIAPAPVEASVAEAKPKQARKPAASKPKVLAKVKAPRKKLTQAEVEFKGA